MKVRVKKVLVTGGAGFIGSFLVDRLVEFGHDVTIFDNLDPQVHPGGALPAFLNKNARFIRADVRDYDAFKKAILDVELIFHYAAAVGVGQSQYRVKYYVDVNCGGTANLLDVIANNSHNVEKLIVASSMSTYGEGRYTCDEHGDVTPNTRTTERMENRQWEMVCPVCGRVVSPAPTDETKDQVCTSIYAMTKRDQEEMVLNIGRTYGIPAVALRFFNVYGPRQSLSNPYTGVAAIFISRIKNGNPPVVFEDGNQSRDFVSVHDIVRASILAMQKEEANHGSFNVGTGRQTTILDVANTLIRLLKSQDIVPDVKHKFRKGDIRHCFSDISKARQVLGYQPDVSFEDGMKELIEWSKRAESEDKFSLAESELRAKGIV